MEAARRLTIPGSEGYPTTDEMPYLAEMLQGRIELVDLEEPACPMTTYSEEGPVLFRIANQNIAEDSCYICDHWVLIDIGQKACKEAKLSQEIKERVRGQNKPRIAFGNSKQILAKGRGKDKAAPMKLQHKDIILRDKQRRNKIAKHYINAA